MNFEKVDCRLDLQRKVCPYPTLEPCLALTEMSAGEVLEVITDYYPERQKIPQLIRELGYSYELVDCDKPVFQFLIRKT